MLLVGHTRSGATELVARPFPQDLDEESAVLTGVDGGTSGVLARFVVAGRADEDVGMAVLIEITDI